MFKLKAFAITALTIGFALMVAGMGSTWGRYHGFMYYTTPTLFVGALVLFAFVSLTMPTRRKPARVTRHVRRTHAVNELGRFDNTWPVGRHIQI